MGERDKTKTVERKNGGILIFYTPLAYALFTRFIKRSKFGIIVWSTEYLIPLFISMLIVCWTNFDVANAIISIIAVYNFYEIGYIQNDCETIKKEKNPTMRLTALQLDFYEVHKYSIYGFRLLIGCLTTWYCVEIGTNLMGIIIMWLIIPLYALYNNMRGRINLYMLLLLTTYRYCVPLYVFGHNTQGLSLALVILFMSYPIPKFIEVCADGKGNPPEKWTHIFLMGFNDRFEFRIKYYLAMTVLCVVLSTISVIPYNLTLLPLYYLLDRLPQLRMKKLPPR